MPSSDTITAPDDSQSLNRRIWMLAGPLMLSNISIPLLGIIDTALLGHLDHPKYLGAVSVGSSVMALVLWSFSFLRMGTTGIVAQFHGSKQLLLAQQTLLRCLTLALLMAALLIVFKNPITSLALNLVNASSDVQILATQYTHIRFLSAPAVLTTYCLTGWLIGSQQTRWVLLVVISMNVLNIALDYLLIIRFDLASQGAAWATVAAEYAGMGIALFAVSKQTSGWHHNALKVLKNLTGIAHILRINRDLMIRTFVLLSCFLFFTAQGAQQHSNILAANAILLQLLLLSAFALDGFAHAAETLCGHALGSNKTSLFFITCRHTLYWSIATSLLLCALFYLIQEPLIAGFTSLEAVRLELRVYYPWLILMPLLAVTSYCLDGIFIGAMHTKAMRNSMLLSALLVYLPLWYASKQWGNHGLWLAFSGLMLARGITMGLIFIKISQRNGWKALMPLDQPK